MGAKREPLPAAVGKHHKREVGRAGANETPLDIRTHQVALDPSIEDYVRDRAGRKLGKFAVHLQRVTVRFDDINGPKHGIDIACKIKIDVEGAPALVIAETASHPRDAFDYAIDAAETTVKRDLEKRGRGAPHARRGNGKARAEQPRAAAPRKGDRRAGGHSTGARNMRLQAKNAEAAFEDSWADGPPSRKSTRRSANHAKRDAPQRLTQVVKSTSPKARATSARTRA
jgi:ribosome-associated translation inhibitor RaiA